jgi:hypothetical protein
MSATALEKLLRANRWRVRTGKYASEDVDGWNGVFLVPIDGELYHVMIGDGMGWKHLSVTNAQRKVLPTWSAMARLKACFFGDDEWAVQYFPAADDYVNDHPFCLHIWMPLDETLPHPNIALV